MEDNLNNTPEEKDQPDEKPVYTDPNADVKEEDTVQSAAAYQYTQSDTSDSYAGYQQNSPAQSGQSSYQYQNGQNANYQYQNTQGSQNSNYQYQQDNLNYNIGNNMGYNQNHYQDMDTSPMSMGDWLLTLLAAMIPCAGIVLYFVWAFSSTGNINRRNFCRAQLVIMGVVMVLYLIIAVVFGMTYLTSMY